MMPGRRTTADARDGRHLYWRSVASFVWMRLNVIIFCDLQLGPGAPWYEVSGRMRGVALGQGGYIDARRFLFCQISLLAAKPMSELSKVMHRRGATVLWGLAPSGPPLVTSWVVGCLDMNSMFFTIRC